MLAAAEADAKERGARVVIAIVDPSGELIELRRTPGAQIASSTRANKSVSTIVPGKIRAKGSSANHLGLVATVIAPP